MGDPAVDRAQARLDEFARGAAVDVGRALIVFPARCVPLDHAAIAWAHASGIPTPPTPAGLGTELVVTSAGLGYLTFPVPYVWWRRWDDLWCSLALIGRTRWRQRTQSVFVADRVPPFEGRAFELPRAAAGALMDFAVGQGAVAPPPAR